MRFYHHIICHIAAQFFLFIVVEIILRKYITDGTFVADYFRTRLKWKSSPGLKARASYKEVEDPILPQLLIVKKTILKDIQAEEKANIIKYGFITTAESVGSKAISDLQKYLMIIEKHLHHQ